MSLPQTDELHTFLLYLVDESKTARIEEEIDRRVQTGRRPDGSIDLGDDWFKALRRICPSQAVVIRDAVDRGCLTADDWERAKRAARGRGPWCMAPELPWLPPLRTGRGRSGRVLMWFQLNDGRELAEDGRDAPVSIAQRLAQGGAS